MEWGIVWAGRLLGVFLFNIGGWLRIFDCKGHAANRAGSNTYPARKWFDFYGIYSVHQRGLNTLPLA
jgi:hypothetical protein